MTYHTIVQPNEKAKALQKLLSHAFWRNTHAADALKAGGQNKSLVHDLACLFH